MRTVRILAVAFLLVWLCAAQSGAALRFVNPAEVSHPPGYSPAVVVNGGKLVYVAGQVGLNSHGEMVGKDDFAAQTTQAFENLKTVLVAAGSSPANLVKLNYYVVGMDDTKLKTLREIRGKYVVAAQPPASTLVGVQALFSKDAMIEIEAVAVAP